MKLNREFLTKGISILLSLGLSGHEKTHVQFGMPEMELVTLFAG
jgi:hypothetical protein